LQKSPQALFSITKGARSEETMESMSCNHPKASPIQDALLVQGNAAPLDQVFAAFPVYGGSPRLLPDVCEQMGITTVGELIAHHEQIALELKRDRYNATRSTERMMLIAMNFAPPPSETVEPAGA